MPYKSKLRKARERLASLGTEAIQNKRNDHIKGNYA